MNTNAWTEGGLTWNNAPSTANRLFGASGDNGAHVGWTTWTWTPTAVDPALDITPADTFLSLFVSEDFHTAQGHVWLSRDYNVATWGTGKKPFLTITTSAVDVPEPLTLLLTGAALAGFGFARHRASGNLIRGRRS